MIDKSKEFYVYYHKNSITGEVFYVGKGKKSRATNGKARSKAWHKYLEDNNCDFIVEYVKTGLSMQEAEELEETLFDSFDTLVNVKKTNKWQTNLLNVCEAFEYDASSPTFLRWKKPVAAGRRKAGDVAGSVTKDGYASVFYNYKPYLAHRLVWVMFNKKEIPFGMVINHIDCNPSNNSIENLECVSFKDNNRRKKHNISDSLLPTNTSGINGVYRSKTTPQGVEGKVYYNWTAIVYENETLNNRSFGVIRYGEELAKEMAIAWREAKECFDEDKELSDKLVEQFNIKYKDILEKRFIDGVNLAANHGKPNQCFVGTFHAKGISKTKRYSINKYGYDEAYRLACEWRKQMEELYCNKPE
jgi:hypothetical protein